MLQIKEFWSHHSPEPITTEDYLTILGVSSPALTISICCLHTASQLLFLSFLQPSVPYISQKNPEAIYKPGDFPLNLGSLGVGPYLVSTAPHDV